MLDVATYETKRIHLLPGDKIVMYSDGLSEAENAAGEFFDRKGFAKTLRANASLSCAELQAKLVEAVQDFSDGAELSDDITTLVLEYRP
jgi:sigma-B regulation protein RsbU (phosphoserine phosphatase)